MLIYKGEIRYTWQDEPIPPQEEGEKFQGSFEYWGKTRKACHKALDKKHEEVRELSKGEAQLARVYKVEVQVTPAKDVILNLLNGGGIQGNAYLSWEWLPDEKKTTEITLLRKDNET